MSKPLTIKDLKNVFRGMDFAFPGKYMEIYPLALKKNPELKKYLDARVKNGLGMWEIPYEK